MKKGLKLALASVALAAVAIQAPVFANYAHATESQVIELQGGGKVKVEGDKVYVIGTDGALKPAPDGTHVTKDGKTITTKGGVIVK